MSNFEYIPQRRLKFIFCPAFLKPVEYWNYQRQEQAHRKSWKIFIVLDLIVIGAAVGVLPLVSDLGVKIFLGVLSLFCLGDLFKTVFSASQKIWWVFLLCSAIILTLAVIFLALFLDSYLLLLVTFFPVNHVIALIRSRKLV